MAEIGSVIDGKYEILTEIGHGGMSVVYLAMDTHLNKQWAVKEIKKKGSGKNDEIVVNSLLAEANMMKRLDHPSLPRIVDIIDNGITIYVVMDYIEGESLDKILAEYGAQPEELVIGWAKQLCDALSYLHSQKPPIIYRDMKPANVMLKPEGNIKIIDFGIAREYKEQSLADTTVLGTKGYAPPEQYSGQTDARSDIYALGMTMHHLLTGIDPRTGEAYAPVRMWNPEVSEGMEMIIDKCVQPAAEHRYQNCQDLLYDLEHPELITRDYKRKQKRKLNCFITSVTLAVVMVISGVVCNIVSTRMNNSDYETLISTSTASSLDDKINNYKIAVEIYPDRTDAYVKMIEAYQDEGTFSKHENDDFLAVYNANKDQLDATSSDVSELNYIIGMLYFNYYTDNNDGDYSFSTRVQKAYPFFNENYQSATGFEEQTIGNTSLQITRGSQEATYKATTLEKTVDIVDGKKTVTKTLTLDRGTMNSEYRSVVASNGVVTQEVAAYTKHASASTTVIDYTNATSSTKNVAAAKAISDSNLKKGITFVKNTASAVSDTSAYLKASDDTQRNTVITNLVKKNYFMSQVDKYIYKYDVNKNEGYILGDLGKKSTKVWNIVTAD